MEPKRQNDINLLVPYVADRVRRIFAAMENRGFDPIAFETLRTPERQRYLYSIGRTRQRQRKPVTWTLNSNHFKGKAVDVVSKSRWWNWPAFFAALKQEANREGMKVLSKERCHIEWRG